MKDWTKRFWVKVDRPKGRGECWNWTAAKDKDGYGIFQLNGKAKKAHRVAWYIKHGRWSKELVRHRCDNPSCVRPQHLLNGSHKDNVADCYRRGRSRWQKGDHPKRLANAITAYREGKMRIDDIVKKFGIGSSTLNVYTQGIYRQSLKRVLTDDQVREIRAAAKRGDNHKTIAQRYGVGHTTISKIINFQRRANV